MKHFFTLLSILVLSLSATAAPTPDYSKLSAHPRIILKSGDVSAIKEKIASDDVFRAMHARVEKRAKELLTTKPVERIKTGKRLLTKAREALECISYNSYMYLVTKKEEYARRAEKEMLAAAAFSDWNPSHFLDVGEMTAALSIGYDWLYDWLSPESRKSIEDAIIEKGLRAAKPKMWWFRSSYNWNQVCNAGLIMGALAVFERIPEEAKMVIKRSLESNPKAQATYGPNGVYPEGYGYWEYGTSFEILLIESLRTALGSSFDLEKAPGFLESAKFMNFMQTPLGGSFNFSDCGSGSKKDTSPFLYWFAFETGDTSLIYTSRDIVRKHKSFHFGGRLAPITLLFAARCDTRNVTPIEENFWVGKGQQPLFIYRSNFTSNKATYLAAKGGSAKTAHGHMDAGSFVYEWNGFRWASDLGMQNYYSLEKLGMRIWDNGQKSQRWKVYRYNNYSHNTLTVNDKLHQYEGMADMVKTYKSGNKHGAKFNLSEMFVDLASAYRTIYVGSNDKVVCIDEIKANNINCDICWNMVTGAKAEIIDDRTISLTHKDKKVILRTSVPNAKAFIKKNHSGKSYDAENKNTVRVGFDIFVKAQAKCKIKVELIPQK